MAGRPVTTSDDAVGLRPVADPPVATPGAPKTHMPAQRLLEGRGWILVRLASDSLLLMLAAAAAYAGGTAAALGSEGQAAIWLYPPLTVGLLALRGAYGRRLHVRPLDGIGSLVGATSLAAIALLAATTILQPETQTAPFIVRVWFFGTVYVVGGHLLLALTQRRARVNGVVGKPTLIVGAGRIGAQVERRLTEQPELGLRPIGYLDSDPPPPDLVPGRRAPVLGPPTELARLAKETGAQHVVFAFLSAPDHVLVPLVRECEDRGLEMSLVPRLFDSINVRVGLEHIGGLPLYGLRAVNPKGWQFAVKHGLGVALAGMLLLLLSPVMLAAAAAVKLSSPGPALFRQRRIGRDGREFDMLKFRSMQPADATETTAASPVPLEGTAPGGVEGADRRTPVGAFLRRTSLDELPQLLNVLKGEMSLVGPRPERPEFVELFGQSIRRYDDRHRVKSGITGWAQVHGLRGKTSLADRVEWDNYYIENWSLGLDLKILLMTLAVLFRPAE